MRRLFGILFLLTGVFAFVGGIYTWGTGLLFVQSDLSKSLIPWGDIIITAPISILSAVGLFNKKKWGEKLGLASSGIYVFGSVLVFVEVVWTANYVYKLLIPSIIGFMIGLSFIIKSIK